MSRLFAFYQEKIQPGFSVRVVERWREREGGVSGLEWLWYGNSFSMMEVFVSARHRSSPFLFRNSPVENSRLLIKHHITIPYTRRTQESS